MNRSVLLCIDRESAVRPSLIGLDGESLDAQGWLACETDATACRETALAVSSLCEAWVLGTDDMEPINLAAALKKVRPDLKVVLVSDGASGSLASRVKSADLDGLWDTSGLARAYAMRKKDAHAAGPSRPSAVVTVVSGSGGSGKSTVSALLAYEARRCGLRTVVLDADLQFGDMHHILGIKNPVRIDEAMTVLADGSREATGRIARLALRGDAEGGERPALIAAPARLEDSEVVMGGIGALVEALRAEFDVVVVNTGAFWCELQAALIEVSDKTLFLMDQRPSSLRSCVHALDLCARMGLSSQSFLFAINRCRRQGLLSSIDASCVLRGSQVHEIPDGGRDVDELLGAGFPDELMRAGGGFPDAIGRITQAALEEWFAGSMHAGEKAEKRRLFGFLRRR